MKLCVVRRAHSCDWYFIAAAVTLQDSMDLLKVEPDSCDDSEVTDVKVEAVAIKEEEVIIKEEEFRVTDEEVSIKEEEDPLLIRLPLIKAEHEVSCMSVCVCVCVCLLLCHFASTQKCLVSFFCLCIGNNSSWVSSFSGMLPILSTFSFMYMS